MIQQPAQFGNRQKTLASLDKQLRKRELLHRKNVKNLMNNASQCRSRQIFDSLTGRLWMILEEYDTESMRKPDPFRPYCPASLSKSGELHLLNQADGLNICIDPNSLVTGLLVIGPQGGGKTMFLIHLCEELLRVQS